MLINSSKKKRLASHILHCRSVSAKAKGLMFSRKIRDKALIFHFNKESLNPIHMLFVFQVIDVLYLDKKKKVIEIVESFRPWHFYDPKKKALYMIELPENTIKNTGTDLGDIISWR